MQLHPGATNKIKAQRRFVDDGSFARKFDALLASILRRFLFRRIARIISGEWSLLSSRDAKSISSELSSPADRKIQSGKATANRPLTHA